jgi:hypothetical protein
LFSDLGQLLTNSAEHGSRSFAAVLQDGGNKYPDHQTPWQEIQRGIVDELSEGMVLKPAVNCQCISEIKGIPRDNHRQKGNNTPRTVSQAGWLR